jgi:hypothetical protein
MTPTSGPIDLSGRRACVGSRDQLYGVRALQLDDGPERGVRLLDVDTGGGLRFDVLVDRGLDIGRCTYRGVGVAWLSATGHVHPHRFERGGDDWLRGFGGGLLTTCGLQTIGAPSEDDGRSWGLHGDASYLPASGVTYAVDEEQGRIIVRGTVRDASALGTVLVLERTIEAELGGGSIRVSDRLLNEGPFDCEYALLYHVNIGHPLLSDTTNFEFPEGDVVEPLDDVARQALGRHDRGAAPDPDGQPEIFLHRVTGQGRVLVSNPVTPIGPLRLAVEYSAEQLPLLWQWRYLRERIYVMGIEPATASVAGRAATRAAGHLRALGRGASVSFGLTLRVDVPQP